MGKLILILLNVLFASTMVLSSKVIVKGREFTHIGSFASRVIDEFDYFVSIVPSTWSDAETDCRFFFGQNATLVAIESEEEWDFLKIRLENYGSQYWTGGMYSSPTSSFVWSLNYEALPAFAPWDAGHPIANPSALHRVSIAHWSRFLAYWRTVVATQLLPYICEIQRAPEDPEHEQPERPVDQAVDCFEENDLVIVLDASTSVGLPNYEKTLSFVERLAAAFTVYAASRFGFIVFANNVKELIHITNSYTRETISSIIIDAPYLKGSTATWLGIDAAIAQFDSSSRDVPLNMVVLTDGMSSDRAKTIAAAQRAPAREIRTFSVGITNAINLDELIVIAGGVTSRIFTADTFDKLINLLAPVSVRVCSENEYSKI